MSGRGTPAALFAALIVLLLPGSANAGRILIDFGTTTYSTPSPDALGRHWNSADLPAQNEEAARSYRKMKLKDDRGQDTGMSLSMPEPVMAAYDSGLNSQDLYPETVGRDRWSLEKGKVESAVLLIEGMNPTLEYDFHFFGVREAPVPLVASYGIGERVVLLASNNNRSNLVTISGVRPDARGSVKIDFKIADGRNANLSAMEITWGGQPPTRPGLYAAARQSGSGNAAPLPPQPQPSPSVQTRPSGEKPSSSAASSPASVNKPAVVTKNPASAAKKEGSKGLLFAGIALVVLGLGLAGLSGYKILR